MGWFGISLKLPNGLLWTTGKKDPGTLSNLYQVVWKLECQQKTFECQNISVNEGDFSSHLCSWNGSFRSQHNHHHAWSSELNPNYESIITIITIIIKIIIGDDHYDQGWLWRSWTRTTSSPEAAAASKTWWKSTGRTWCLSSMTVIVIDIIIIILYHHHHQSDDDDNDGLLFRALGQGAFGEVYQGLFKKSQNGEVRELGHPLEKLDFLREKKTQKCSCTWWWW